jgi:acyl-CoA ligase (AMP-forming) (exosortase A-associated)
VARLLLGPVAVDAHLVAGTEVAPSVLPPEATVACARVESLLLAAAAAHPHATALVDRDRRVTYGALAESASAMSRALARSGVERGDRVAILLDKTVEAAAALFGGWAAGAIVVPIHDGAKSRQVAHILRHSRASCLVSTERKLRRLEPESYAGVTVVDAMAAGDSPAATTALPPSAQRPEASKADDPALLLYTSGSTGLPKGIVISHGNLLAGVRIVSRYLDLRPDDRILSVLPWSFDYGLNQLLSACALGATLVLQRSHLPADICRALADHEITGCAGVPPLWIQLLSEISPLSRMSLPSLRYLTNSGGALPAAIVARYRALLPHTRIYLMYGLTEAFRSTYLPPELIDERPTSMGRAIPETEILVVAEDGRTCGPGEVGELVHRGPTVAQGYWDDPEATARVWRPDTLPGGDPRRQVVFSGDLVRRDQDGWLYFVSRRDCLIKTQGHRVSPEEVEEVLLESPLVGEAAVCGRADPERGMRVVAHVVPARPESAGAAPSLLRELDEFCRREMPSHMVPTIVLHESLPRTSSGKIDRQRLS